MKKQIQFTYERSSNLYMELFFSSGSLSDFLNKNEYIEQLSAYQKKVLDEYKAAQAAMEQKQEELELAKAQQEQNREELADYRVQVVVEQGRIRPCQPDLQLPECDGESDIRGGGGGPRL